MAPTFRRLLLVGRARARVAQAAQFEYEELRDGETTEQASKEPGKSKGKENFPVLKKIVDRHAAATMIRDPNADETKVSL
jgi:hypothetical protein